MIGSCGCHSAAPHKKFLNARSGYAVALDNGMSEQETSEKPSTRPDKPDPWRLIRVPIDKFLNDLECLSEMFSLVAPTLKGRDEERDRRIKEMTAEIEADGKKSVRLASAEDVKELIGHLKKVRRAERMFRHSQITAIVSRFDEFLIQILKVAYQQNLGWLKNPEKSMS